MGKRGGGGGGRGGGGLSTGGGVSASAGDIDTFARKTKHTILRLQGAITAARLAGATSITALEAIVTAIGAEVDAIRVELASYTGEDTAAAIAACDAIDAAIDTDLAGEATTIQAWLDLLG